VLHAVVTSYFRVNNLSAYESSREFWDWARICAPHIYAAMGMFLASTQFYGGFCWSYVFSVFPKTRFWGNFKGDLGVALTSQHGK
jgi:hypothetical protein